MEEQLLKYLADKIDEDIHSRERDIVQGGLKTLEDYRGSCGIIRGLLMAKNHILTAAERISSDDD